METPPLRLRSAPSHKRETENTSKASPLGQCRQLKIFDFEGNEKIYVF